MKNKIVFLMILLSVISNVSACSFKASTENNQTASNPAKVEENTAAIKKSALSESDSSALSQTGGQTGTYEYKSDGANNEISIRELEGNKLRIKLYASYEYEINGNLNVNVGEAKGVVTLNGDTAVFVPEDSEDCKIVLKFSGSKIIVKQESKSNCGFGLNAYAGGTYRKVNNKPDFGDSDDTSTSASNSTASEQNSKTERIRFAPGKSSTVVSGRISNGVQKIYLIGGRAGQTIEIKITDGGANHDVVFSLIAPDGVNPMGDDESGDGYDTGWKGKLPKTGDYKIEVGAIESKNVNFKMSVSIQ